MSNIPEVSTPKEKDDDELVVERVVRERGSDRPKEIIVRKGGLQCTVTPRQVVKIEEDDLPDFANDNAKTRSAPQNPEQPKQNPEQPKENPEQQPKEKPEPSEQQENPNESKIHAMYDKVATSCSNAYQSAKNWFLNLF